jgi:hypothetical protein
MSEVSSLLTQSIDTERNAFHLFSHRENGDAGATADVGLGAGWCYRQWDRDHESVKADNGWSVYVSHPLF